MHFLYFILADDSGEFIFRNCSPLSCGNSDVLPAPFESPASFFHRLLVSDVPAIATPVFGIDDADCVGAADMRVCTSTIDHKVPDVECSCIQQPKYLAQIPSAALTPAKPISPSLP